MSKIRILLPGEQIPYIPALTGIQIFFKGGNMISNFSFSDTECNLLVLNFASNLINHLPNQEMMIDEALETITDFSNSQRSALFIYEEKTDLLQLEAFFQDGHVFRKPASLRMKGTGFEKVFNNGCYSMPEKRPEACKSVLPSIWGECPGQCVFLPVVTTKNRKIGIVVLCMHRNQELSFESIQYLRQFMTVLAIAMENSRLYELAVVDGLTGLFVRRYYDLRIREELAKLKRLGRGSLAIILMDIDNFKLVNDIHGHQEGDRLLVKFAGLLKKSVRQNIDVACRYGGEEFILLMPGTSLYQAVETAQRLQDICAAHDYGIKRPEISFSAGVAASMPPDLLSPEDLLKKADARLYRAKQSGRNRVVWQD